MFILVLIDDESSINISNNSMGVPLNCSTSSEENNMMSGSDDFVMPSYVLYARLRLFSSHKHVTNCVIKNIHSSSTLSIVNVSHKISHFS